MFRMLVVEEDAILTIDLALYSKLNSVVTAVGLLDNYDAIWLSWLND